MAKQLVNEFADISALEKQKAQVIGILDDVMKKLKELQGQGISFSGDSKNSSSLKEAQKTIDEQSKSIQKLEAEQKKLIATQQEAYKVEQQIMQVRKEAEKQAKLQAQATNDQIGAYKRLEAEAQLATQKFRDLAAQYGIESKEAKEASVRAAELNAKLLEIDKTVNLHQRNVGNYGGTVMSVRQEIRTLTQALAQMEMQGNANSKEAVEFRKRLGELKDAMGDTQNKAKFWADDNRWINSGVQAMQGLIGAYSAFNGVMALTGTQNEDLQKSMQRMQALMSVMMGIQQVTNVLQKDSMVISAKKAIAEKANELQLWASTNAATAQAVATEAGTVAANASAVAWRVLNTVMKSNVFVAIAAAIVTVAVSLYEVNKIISENNAQMIKAATHSKEYTDYLIKQNEAQAQLNENIGQEQIKMDIMFGTAKNFINDKVQYKRAIDDINAAYGQYLPNLLTEKSTLEDLSKAYDLVIANIKLKMQSEIASTAAMDAMKEVAKKTSEANLLAYDINRLKEYLSLQSNNTVATAESAAETELLNKKYEGTISRLGNTSTALQLAETRQATLNTEIQYFNKSIDDSINKSIDFASKIKTYDHATSKAADSTKRQTAANIELVQSMQQINQIFVRGGNTSLMDRIGDGDKLDILIRKLVTGAITMEQFTLAANALLESSIVTFTDIDQALYKINKSDLGEGIIHNLQEMKISAEGALDALNQLYEKDLITFEEYEKEKTKISDEQTHRRELVQQKAFEVLNDFTQKAFSTVSAYLSQSNEEASNAIQENFDGRMEAIKNLLDAGVISQEEYNSRSKQLDAERDKELLEQKRKYAKQQRDLMAFQTIINTAAAVVQQLATGTGAEAIIGAIAVGVMGAAELATIYAQPLPTFSKGTENAPEGWAVTGEKGHELIESNGNYYMTPDAATLTYLNAGDKVYTHSKTLELEQMIGLTKLNNINRTDESGLMLIGEIRELKDVFKNKPSASINIDKNGINFMLANGNRRVKYINNYIKSTR